MLLFHVSFTAEANKYLMTGPEGNSELKRPSKIPRANKLLGS